MTDPTIIIPTPQPKTPGQRISYIVGQLIPIAQRVDGDDMELGSVAITLGIIGNDIDTEFDRMRAELADTTTMRDFHQRSAGHIAAKRNLAEIAIASWDRGEISGDAAVILIRKALANGPTASDGE